MNPQYIHLCYEKIKKDGGLGYDLVRLLKKFDIDCKKSSQFYALGTGSTGMVEIEVNAQQKEAAKKLVVEIHKKWKLIKHSRF